MKQNEVFIKIMYSLLQYSLKYTLYSKMYAISAVERQMKETSVRGDEVKWGNRMESTTTLNHLKKEQTEEREMR